jgi:hypothetical protein
MMVDSERLWESSSWRTSASRLVVVDGEVEENISDQNDLKSIPLE